MSVPGLSLLGLKHIREFVSILRSINSIIIMTKPRLRLKGKSKML